MKIIFRIIISSCLIITFGCNRQKGRTIIEKQLFGYNVKAFFNDSNNIDGLAKFYDTAGTLVSSVSYQNGIREGTAVSYYRNGKVLDSVLFVNDLENGISYNYDSLGNILSRENYFYGNKSGDQYLYKNGKIDQYFFSDFNKNDLVYCTYDSNGKCNLEYFRCNPIFTDPLMEGKPATGIFMYFPKPHDLKMNYVLGQTNDKNVHRNEVELNSARFFIDTTLALPEQGWYYYISVHVENKKDSINKLFLTQYK